MNLRKKRFRNRAGFTLVHQMIFIAMLPVVILAATKWVHESLKMTSRFKHRRESHVAMSHLSNQIQDNVRGCKSLKLNRELNQIELTGHEAQQTLFKIDDNDIHKTTTVDGEVVGRENFRLSEEYFAKRDPTAGPNGVALNIFRHSNPLNKSTPDSLVEPEPKLEFVITAKANRWKRSIKFGQTIEAGDTE